MRTIISFFLKDMKEFFRDRKTLLYSIFIPMVSTPIFVFGLKAWIEHTDSKPTLNYHIQNNDTVDTSILELKNWNYKTSHQWEQDLLSKSLDISFQIPENFQQELEQHQIPNVIAFYNNLTLKPKPEALGIAEEALTNLQNKKRSRLAEDLNLNNQQASAIKAPFSYEVSGIASAREKAGQDAGVSLALILVLVAISGMFPIALDIGAGEKERGTLETLITTPTKLASIAIGKTLAVLVVGVGILVLTVSSLIISKLYFNIDLSFFDMILCGMVSLPIICVVSPIILSFSVYASSYKEAQNYLSVFLILGMMIFMPMLSSKDQTLDSNLWIPGVNSMFAIREIAQGTFHMTHFGPIIVTSLLGSILAVIGCIKVYEKKGQS